MPSNMIKAINLIRGIILIAPWVVHLFAADLALSMLLPVSAFFPTVAYNASSVLAAGVWRGIQFIFTRLNGARITTSGSRLPPGESAIVVANHVSWTDFYMIQELAIRAGMLGRCRYFAKRSLRYVPFLGWGLWAMGMPLVSRNWLTDQAEMTRVFDGIVKNSWPIWLISYSEATRYTDKKFRQAVEWCKANGKPVPKHTLHPRTKGFVATVKQLRRSSHVKAVYDITIAYSKGGRFMVAPSMWETVSAMSLNQRYHFHADVQRYPLDELPASDEKLAQWLEDRWAEKGKRLEQIKLAYESNTPVNAALA